MPGEEGGTIETAVWVLMPEYRGILAHVGLPGPAPFVAIGLFLVGAGAAFGAYRFSDHPDPRTRRIGQVGLGLAACACLLVATFLPLFLGARPSLGRPSTTARLTVLFPRPGEVFRGDPATLPVDLQLVGGRVVSTTSLRLMPNEGHIHLNLDGSLVAMSGLQTNVFAAQGPHTLSAEFVAIDHGPFEPRIVAMVRFTVEP
jgi:hypothetical protein